MAEESGDVVVRSYVRKRTQSIVHEDAKKDEFEGQQTFQVDKLQWPEFRRRFARLFKQGHQIILLGGPDAGKTHLAVLLAEIRRFTFMIVTKPRDQLIPAMAERGWAISNSLEPAAQLIYVTDDRGNPVIDPRTGAQEVRPVFPRFVYWPQPLPDPRLTLRQDAIMKATQIEAALMMIKTHGSWCVVVDELNYLSQTLGLRDDLAEMYHTARSNFVSIVGAAQRPSWVPRAAVDNPSHIFVFQAGDRDELRRLGEITGGLSSRQMAEEISTLNWSKHEFLYVNPHRRVAMRSSAPPW